MQEYHKHSMIYNFSIKNNSCLFVLNVTRKKCLFFLKKKKRRNKSSITKPFTAFKLLFWMSQICQSLCRSKKSYYRHGHHNVEFQFPLLIMKNPQSWSNFVQTLRDYSIHCVVNPWKFELNWTKIVDFSSIALKAEIPH